MQVEQFQARMTQQHQRTGAGLSHAAGNSHPSSTPPLSPLPSNAANGSPGVIDLTQAAGARRPNGARSTFAIAQSNLVSVGSQRRVRASPAIHLTFEGSYGKVSAMHTSILC